MINKTIFFGVLLAISTNLYADSVNIQRPIPLKASQSEAEAGTDNSKMMTPLRTQQVMATLGGNVVGQASSIDEEITLFSGTTGKVIKRATTTGLVKSTSGVISSVTTSAGLAGEISDETGSGALVFGTSPVFTTQITTPFIDTTTNPGINVGTGIVSYSGIETIVKFNASSTFVVPKGVTSLKVLVVGGGAGGDGGISAAVYGHGGGGGRVTYRSAFSVTPESSHTVTIGAGGAAGAMDSQASPGVQSAFGSVTAAGGIQANNIGSGGDGGDSGNDINTVVTNYNGLTDSTWGGAGGAGAGGVGGTVTNADGGTGGAGYSSSITGNAVAYGTGGDGSGTGTGTPPTIDANLGLGGHGHGTSPRAGGSGVIIVRFITTYDTLTVNDKFRIDNNGKASIGGTTANNSLTVVNSGVNGVAIDLRSDDTDLAGVNDFSVARLLADFTSTSYVDSRLYLQTATGDNAWKTGLTIKDGNIVSPTFTGTVTIPTPFTLGAVSVVATGTELNYTDGVTSAIQTQLDGKAPTASPTFTGNVTMPGTGIWNSSGNVGIGEASPGSKLSVSGGGSFGAAYDTTAAPTNGLIVEGNVGVGTSTPAPYRFVVSENAGTGILNTGEGDTLYQQDAFTTAVRRAFSVKVNSYDSVYLNTQNSYPLVFGVSTAATGGTAVPHMTMLSSGNVGIGLIAPVTKLQVAGGNIQLDNTQGIYFRSAGGTAATNNGITGYDGPDTLTFRTAAVDRMTINVDNVGIGTSTPSAQLHTTGTVRFQNFGAGTATFDANGNISSVSDERFKNVVSEFTVGLNQILGINPIQYRWNTLSGLDKDNLYIGFSAQNVRKYIPEAVSIDSRGYYNMQDRPLIAALVNSVKQLTKEVDELRIALNLAKIDRTSVDKAIYSPIVKSKIASLKKECGITEIVKEPKIVVENIDGIEVTKTVEVLKEGITERNNKYYRLETYEEASQRYLTTSQN